MFSLGAIRPEILADETRSFLCCWERAATNFWFLCISLHSPILAKPIPCTYSPSPNVPHYRRALLLRASGYMRLSERYPSTSTVIFQSRQCVLESCRRQHPARTANR